MKNTDLLQYIGEIDDKYIAECDRAMTPKKADRRWGAPQWRWAGVLMLLVVVICSSVVTVRAIRLNRPILRYERGVWGDNYWIWADLTGMEDPIPSQIDVRYTIPKLPEEFQLTEDRCQQSIETNGTVSGPKESLLEWENWGGSSITLRQYVLTMQCQVRALGELQRVQVGECPGYLCKWTPGEVIVWATDEYLFVLELRGGAATGLGLEDLAESIVPENSIQPPEEEEKEYLDLNLTFNPKWNYQTICRHAYIDDLQYVHFSPEFLAEVPEAAQYEQRQGAIAVWNMRDTGFVDHVDEEVFILWDDGSVVFLHISEENFRKKYDHSKEPLIYKWTEENRVWYHLDDGWQEMESRLMRWRCWEKLLEDKKVAWVFDSDLPSRDYPGMVLTDGTLIYFPRPWYMISTDTGKPYTEGMKQTTYTTVKPVAGMHFITTAGRHNILTQYGVVKVSVYASGTVYDMVWDLNNIVQANGNLILRTNGRLEIKKGSEKAYRALDEQYVRIFPGAGYGLTVDNRLVRYLHSVDGPDEITLKEGGELDQLTDDLVVVYKDGTIQYPADVSGADWLATVSKVRTLDQFVLSRLPEVEEETLPIPKGK